MAVTVSFCKAGTPPGTTGLGVAVTRAMEVIAVSGTTTTTAEDGEFIIIGNAETSMIRAAIGTTPDADATAQDGTVTSAGFPIGSNSLSVPFCAVAGAKVNVELAD